MILTVEELRTYITTDISDELLSLKLSAIESLIRKHTNNNFQNRAVRCQSAIEGGVITSPSPYFKVGDTVQISENPLNNGLYVIGEGMSLSPSPLDYEQNLITKVVYPDDIKIGVVDMLKWKLRNEERNSGDTDKQTVQSETISRHSVTYAADNTESDIDERLGYPRKLTAFLKPYMKARF